MNFWKGDRVSGLPFWMEGGEDLRGTVERLEPPYVVVRWDERSHSGRVYGREGTSARLGTGNLQRYPHPVEGWGSVLVNPRPKRMRYTTCE